MDGRKKAVVAGGIAAAVLAIALGVNAASAPKPQTLTLHAVDSNTVDAGIEDADTEEQEPVDVSELEELGVIEVKRLASEKIEFDGNDVSADAEAIEVEADSGRVVVAEVSDAEPARMVEDAALRSAALAKALDGKTVSGEPASSVTWTVSDKDRTVVVAVANDPATAPEKGSVKEALEASSGYDMTENAHKAVSDLGIEKSKGEAPADAQGKAIVPGETTVDDIVHDEPEADSTLAHPEPEAEKASEAEKAFETESEKAAGKAEASEPAENEGSEKAQDAPASNAVVPAQEKPRTETPPQGKSQSQSQSQSSAQGKAETPSPSKSKPSGHWEERTVVDKAAWTETVQHPAVTHTEQVWVPKIETYEQYVNTTKFCQCGFSTTDRQAAIAHADAHMDKGEPANVYTVDNYETVTVDNGHYETKTVTDKAAWTETIEHPAVTHTEKVWVED